MSNEDETIIRFRLETDFYYIPEGLRDSVRLLYNITTGSKGKKLKSRYSPKLKRFSKALEGSFKVVEFDLVETMKGLPQPFVEHYMKIVNNYNYDWYREPLKHIVNNKELQQLAKED